MSIHLCYTKATYGSVENTALAGKTSGDSREKTPLFLYLARCRLETRAWVSVPQADGGFAIPTQSGKTGQGLSKISTRLALRKIMATARGVAVPVFKL